jgi:hypothetical protein
MFEGEVGKARGVGEYKAADIVSEMSNLFNVGNGKGLGKRGSVGESNGNKGAGKLGARRALKRKMAINPFVDGYLFPNINIRIVNKIGSIREIEGQSITVNFEKIFKRLIRTQLMGEFTSNFMLKM